MWLTKYALAVPKNLGVGVDFRLCSEGNFLNGRPQSVNRTMKNMNSNSLVIFSYGAFIYYACMFLELIEPPTYLATYIFSVHNLRENCHFPNHLPTPVVVKCYLIMFKKSNGLLIEVPQMSTPNETKNFNYLRFMNNFSIFINLYASTYTIFIHSF